MFKFSNILPYSAESFFVFMAASIALILLGKFLLKNKVKLRILIFIISFAYLILLFPKPFQLLGILTYSYLVYFFFSQKLKYPNLLLPIILISIPLFLMKLTNVLFVGGESLMEKIFQVGGLSFATFRIIQLYIDESGNSSKIKIIDFFNFTAFTPTILIGPLDKFKRFTEEIQLGYETITWNKYTDGFHFLLKGLLYKFIIGEAIHSLVLEHLVNDGSLLYQLSYMYVYLFYLFFDFAGYSLLAMSFGAFLGISVPLNFNKPFLSENPKMFWQRWHKSLGDWLNDYFFKPVFKELTSKGIWNSIRRQNVALFLTFTVMGFWNGFEIHFIVSGILFGLYSMIHNYYFYLCKKNKKDVFFGNLKPIYVKYLSIFMMFNLTAFAIYIFSGKLF